MLEQEKTATKGENSTSVAQRRNLNLAAEDLNLLNFAKENQGSILQRIKKYLSLQCEFKLSGNPEKKVILSRYSLISGFKSPDLFGFATPLCEAFVFNKIFKLK